MKQFSEVSRGLEGVDLERVMLETQWLDKRPNQRPGFLLCSQKKFPQEAALEQVHPQEIRLTMGSF